MTAHSLRRWAPGVAVAVATLGLSWSLAAAGGAAGIPRTDDWSFGRVAIELHRSGHFRLVGWSPMNLVGLVVWAQPWLAVLGNHTWVLDVAAGVLVSAGVVGAYRLGGRTVTPGEALLSVAGLAVFGGFARDASTFMTDGPATAVQALCLALGASALSGPRRSRGRRRCAALVLGFWAFSIRELAVAAPLAVMAASVAADRAAQRLGDAPPPRARVGQSRRLAIEAALFVAACIALWAWRQSLPHGQPYNGRPPFLTFAAFVVAAAATTSLGLSAALAWTWRQWWPARSTLGAAARGAGALAGAGLLSVLPAYARTAHQPTRWLVGDYLTRQGVNGNKINLGHRPAVLAPFPWAVVNLAAVGAFVIICALLAEWIAGQVEPATTHGVASWWRESNADPLDVLLGSHLAVTAGLLIGAAWINGALYDRYLWPALLSGSLLVLRRGPARGARPRPGARVASIGLLGALALLSLILTANSDAFDGARWRAGRHAVGRGLPAVAVDAGFEWVGSHALGVADEAREGTGPNRSWWANMLGGPRVCEIVASSPTLLPGYSPTGTVAWRTWLVAGRAHLAIYTDTSGCGAAVPGP